MCHSRTSTSRPIPERPAERVWRNTAAGRRCKRNLLIRLGRGRLKVKPALNGGGGGLVTGTVCLKVAVRCGYPPSLPVSTTVDGPAGAYAWLVVGPVPVVPS